MDLRSHFHVVTLLSSVLFLFYFYFSYNFIVPLGFIPWKIRVAFPGESQLRQIRATQPTVHAGRFSVSIIHRTLTWTTGSNVRTDVDACGCTLGCTDTVKESALKADAEKKIPRRTGESNLPQRRAGPMLYRLSYIPTFFSSAL